MGSPPAMRIMVKKRVVERLSPPTPTGYMSPRTEDRKALKQRVIPDGAKHFPLRVILSEANRKAVCEVEVLRHRSKTEERSDEGIYEGIPIAFHRKLTSLEKGDSKSR